MLMDFIKMNVQKLNIPKLIHACERPETHRIHEQNIDKASLVVAF